MVDSPASYVNSEFAANQPFGSLQMQFGMSQPSVSTVQDVTSSDQRRDAQLKAKDAEALSGIGAAPSMFTDPEGTLRAAALQQVPLLKRQISDEDRLAQQEEANQDQYRTFMANLIKQQGVSADDLKPRNAQQEQQKYQTNLWAQFGSPGFIVAMLASAFTAKPMNSALQSGGAAMDAINKGDMAAYKRDFDAWKENSDLAIKRMTMEHEEFQDVHELASSDLDQFHERLQTMLAKYGDERKLMLLNAGLDDQVIQSFSALGNAIPRLEQAQQAIEMNEIRRRLVMQEIGDSKDPKAILAATQRAEELIAATQAPKTPEEALWNKFMADPKADHSLDGMTKFYTQLEQAKHPSIYGGMKGPEMVSQIGDGIIAGLLPPDLSRLYGMSGPVQAYLKQKNFNLTGAVLSWRAAEKQVQSLNGPQMVRFVALAHANINTIHELKRLSEQMQLSGIPAFNKLELQSYIQTQGNTEKGQLAAQYLTTVGVLQEEMANIISGGYAPHEAAWELAFQQINGNYGVDELSASINEVERLLNYRLTQIPGLSAIGPGSSNQYMPQGASSTQMDLGNDPMGLR